jgi:hypothetical protein
MTAGVRAVGRFPDAPLAVEQIRQALWENGLTIALFAVGFLLCLYGVAAGIRRLWQAYAVWSNESIAAAEVHLADGVVELEGTAETLERTVESPYTDTTCLAYEYEKKRKEHDHGGDDHDSTWNTVDSGRDGAPFLLADDSGTVAVDPGGAELALGSDDIEGGTRTRKIENRLEPGDPIHVYGQRRSAAEQREDALDQQRYYVGDGDAVSTFRITDGSETWAVAGLLGQGLFLIVVCSLLAGICGLFVLDFLGFEHLVFG